MTKSQATQFDYFSEKNAKRLHTACDHCEPYTDWFTFGRWVKQGFHINRGSHATRIPILVERCTIGKSGKQIIEKFPIYASVFCRCQVEAK